jgi:perosamine synthetase
LIPITRPYVDAEEAQAAGEVVLSGWLSQGQRVQEFESIVASYTGAREAVATTNCTSALHLALLAAGVQKNQEVICPSLSFIATANAILHCGAKPVFVDIDPRTYTVDPSLVEAAISPATAAIMPVDQIGLAADVTAIAEIAGSRGVRVVEDAAPSMGASINGKRIGGLSDFTCFSFHPRKSITTGEGGMITTNETGAAERIRRLRSHAASTSDLARHLGTATGLEQYCELGYNYRMTDVQAAIGIVQMTKLEKILEMRRNRARSYGQLLRDMDGLELPFEPEDRCHTFQSYCIRLTTKKPRDTVMTELAERGVASRRGVMAIHLEPFYRRIYPDLHLPLTERAAEQTMLLPLYANMSDDEQLQVVEALRSALR